MFLNYLILAINWSWLVLITRFSNTSYVNVGNYIGACGYRGSIGGPAGRATPAYTGGPDGRFGPAATAFGTAFTAFNAAFNLNNPPGWVYVVTARLYTYKALLYTAKLF